MTIVNIHLTGELEKEVMDYMRRGYATSKAEVVRMGLISLLKNERKYEDVSDDPELEKYLKDLKSGKIKPKYKGPYKTSGELFKDLKS